MVHPRPTFWSRRMPRIVAWGMVVLAAGALAWAAGDRFLQARAGDGGARANGSAGGGRAATVSGDSAPPEVPGRTSAPEAAPIHPSGHVLPGRAATICSAVKARVLAHALRVGAEVSADMELVTLDSREVDHRIADLALRLVAVEAERKAVGKKIDLVAIEKESLAASLRRIEAERTALEARIERAAVWLVETERDLAQQEAVIARSPGAISEDVVRRARTARDMAEQDHRALVADRGRLEEERTATLLSETASDKEREGLEVELEILDGKRALLENDRAKAMKDSTDYRIRPPFAGIVAERHVEAGEEVAPGAPLFEVVDAETVRVEFFVSQRKRPGILAGTRIAVSAESFPGVRFGGTVVEVAPRAEPRTHKYRVVLETPARSGDPGSEDARLWPGMIVEVLIEGGGG
ncbi:MAG: efflux RND transporter periplasmic adaptor subunit [Planctomycetes bacterium]|nr:efflux RND transporter periplasmic adaptor subunit [Planctomycetota bacterium]